MLPLFVLNTDQASVNPVVSIPLTENQSQRLRRASLCRASDHGLASVVGIQVTILIAVQRTRNIDQERLLLSTQVSDSQGYIALCRALLKQIVDALTSFSQLDFC